MALTGALTEIKRNTKTFWSLWWTSNMQVPKITDYLFQRIRTLKKKYFLVFFSSGTMCCNKTICVYRNTENNKGYLQYFYIFSRIWQVVCWELPKPSWRGGSNKCSSRLWSATGGIPPNHSQCHGILNLYCNDILNLFSNSTLRSVLLYTDLFFQKIMNNQNSVFFHILFRKHEVILNYYILLWKKK